jgi:IS1 family transposase
MTSWIVYTYQTVAGETVCHAYGPTDQQTAQEYAASVNAASAPGGVYAMAVALEAMPEPGA